jgi:hypothetical protein
MSYAVEVEKRDFFTTTGFRKLFVGVVKWYEPGSGKGQEATCTKGYEDNRVASRQAGRLRKNYQSYLESTGKRWEVEQAEKVSAKKAADKTAKEFRERIRSMAPDFLAVLLDIEHMNAGDEISAELIERVRALTAKAKGD